MDKVASRSSPSKLGEKHEHSLAELAAPGVVDEPPRGFLANAKAFVDKVNNDWVMNLAAMLAYNLLTAILPLMVAIVGIAGLLLGNFGVRAQVIDILNESLPSAVRDNTDLPSIIENFNQSSGLIGLLGLLGLILGGSNLFVTMEAALNIVFRAQSRSPIAQRLLAIAMVFLFTFLVVVFAIAGSLPGYADRLARALHLPELTGLIGLTSPLVATLSAFVLFVAIYAIVPNMKVGLHHAWRGALIAAVLLTLVTLVFPLYANLLIRPEHYGTFVGFALLAIIWLWLFSVILLLGAEINSYFGLGQRAAAGDLPAVLHHVQVHGRVATATEDAPRPPEGHAARPQRQAKEEASTTPDTVVPETERKAQRPT